MEPVPSAGVCPPTHVVTVTDKAFLPWCACTILSCAEASADVSLALHVIVADDVDDGAIGDLASIASARGAAFEARRFDDRALLPLPTKGAADGHRISWARVLLGELLPDVPRVVYLDADTLVRRSVGELATSVEDAPIAAVNNITDPSMYEHVAALGIGPPTNYFNAGVLVIDLDDWRRSGVTEQVFELARHRELPWFDQDALNLVFAGRWQRLHPRWNAMNSFWGWPDASEALLGRSALDEARKDPAILHFEGPPVVKPWHYLSRHPLREEYRSTLLRTPWRDHELEGRTPTNRAIARLPQGSQLAAYARAERARARLGALAARARR